VSDFACNCDVCNSSTVWLNHCEWPVTTTVLLGQIS